MLPVRVARAFRLPIIAAMTALALTGCMRPSGPVVMAQPPSDLDTIAYGQPYHPASAAYVSSPAPGVDSGSGAIAALRTAFASSPRVYVAAPASALVDYAVAPIPVRYDAAYR